MGDWRTYWRDVCAPKLKSKKDELGREMPERAIAAAVEAASGKNTSRGLVSLWLLGEREPYISQFYALCDKLGCDPVDVLRKEKVKEHIPLRRVVRKTGKVLERKPKTSQ